VIGPVIASLVRRPAPRTSRVQDAARWLLGAALLFAGTSHLTTARQEFQAQVPAWFPVDSDVVVVVSGVAEIGLGLGLLLLARPKVLVGIVVAGFFVAVFPGNVAQYVEGTDAFGLESDRARLVRLFFQPLLVLWALWSTGALRAVRETVAERRALR
jgi:uncharacterized membrane protein